MGRLSAFECDFPDLRASATKESPRDSNSEPTKATAHKECLGQPFTGISLQEYLAAARRLCLRRDGNWAVQLQQKRSKAQTGKDRGDTTPDMTYAVGTHAHRRQGCEEQANSMYGWMNRKKKEQVKGMEELVEGMLARHHIACVADIGTLRADYYAVTITSNAHASTDCLHADSHTCTLAHVRKACAMSW